MLIFAWHIADKKFGRGHKLELFCLKEGFEAIPKHLLQQKMIATTQYLTAFSAEVTSQNFQVKYMASSHPQNTCFDNKNDAESPSILASHWILTGFLPEHFKSDLSNCQLTT